MKYVLFFLLSFSLFSQTKTDLQQQVKTVVTEASLIMALPNNGGFVPVKIDSSLSLVLSNGVYTLVVSPQQSNVTFKEDAFKTTTLQSVFTCSAPLKGVKENLVVFYNGLLQRDIEDYAFTQTGGICTITFNRQIPPEQLITIRYPI